jgi:hypothetical protein
MMKIGSVVKIKKGLAPAHGWLWVYGGVRERGGRNHEFRAVADGFIGWTDRPEASFENWEEEDDTEEG